MTSTRGRFELREQKHRTLDVRNVHKILPHKSDGRISFEEREPTCKANIKNNFSVKHGLKYKKRWH